MDTKRCTKCSEVKNLSDFYIDRRKKDGRRSACKVCYLEIQHKYYYSNPEKIRTQSHACYISHRDVRRKYLSANKEKARDWLLKKYGLSSEKYNILLDSQFGKCAICGNDNGGKYLHVDHDHVTGKVRGLLCSECNHGLGNFRDDSELIKKAELYLIEHTAR
jgi:hypothetical protein